MPGKNAAFDKFEAKWNEDKFVCVGLDSEYAKLPQLFSQKSKSEAIFEFNSAIIDATSEIVLCFKPNTAFYEGEGSEGYEALTRTMQYLRDKYPEIPVILDAKRADIGNTNRGYVKMAFDELGADAITVSPYLGASFIFQGKREFEALSPFFELKDKLIFVLCRTSNKSSGELQDLPVSIKNLPPEYKNRFGNLEKLYEIVGSDTVPLYLVVAYLASTVWNANGNLGLVVGATYPDEVFMIRKVASELPILMPGVGAQGGDSEKALESAFAKQKRGLIVNSSRGIIFASTGSDFADAAKAEAQSLSDRISNIRHKV